MARWRLFGILKEKEPTKTEEVIQEVEVQPIKKEAKNEPLVQYSETLYTQDSKSKKTKGHTEPVQQIWRNVDLIEEKIDTLHITRAKKPVTELDKTIDKLIEKRLNK